MKKILSNIMLFAVILFSVATARADIAYWTDWTSSSSQSVSGTLNINSKVIDVTFSGDHSTVQTNGGTNYWIERTPPPYTSGIIKNAPPASDIIELNTGVRATITFSEKVENPVIALVSWNSNTVDFGVPIKVISYGYGYWGNGTPILNSAGTGFYGQGEVHGIIMLEGLYDSISFTHNTEYWHGLTVGAMGTAPTPTPVPAAAWLFGSGIIGLLGYRRKISK